MTVIIISMIGTKFEYPINSLIKNKLNLDKNYEIM